MDRYNAYELTSGEIAGFSLRTGALFALALAGAYVALNAHGAAWTVIGLVMLLAGGVVIAAYIVPAWAAWVTHLRRDDAARIAEIMATTPALLQAEAETKLTEARTALVREIADLPQSALDYALRMIETGGALVDGALLKWRLDGTEYPAAWALVWYNAYQTHSTIPRDSEWSPEYPLPREDWRRLASAMARHLVRMGVAEQVPGPVGPRWAKSASPERRADALRQSGVIIAAGLYAASVEVGGADV